VKLKMVLRGAFGRPFFVGGVDCGGASRVEPGQEGDPSSRKALLRMTAKCGLGGRTERLGEEDRTASKD
jgi:hypothetical protein